MLESAAQTPVIVTCDCRDFTHRFISAKSGLAVDSSISHGSGFMRVHDGPFLSSVVEI